MRVLVLTSTAEMSAMYLLPILVLSLVKNIYDVWTFNSFATAAMSKA